MTKKIQINSISYKMTLESLNILIEKIKDLTKLNNEVLINISNNEMLLFSVVGKNLNNVHAFKSHIINLKDLFSVNKNHLDGDLLYIISDGKKFVTSMTVFYKYMKTQKIEDDLEFKLFFNEEFCEKLLIKNSKSKEEIPGGKPNNHTHRLTTENILEVMNTDNAEYSFDLTKEDFNYIKSKTVIEKENDILYLNINNNKLSIGENRWDHNICDIEHDDTTITFPKKYFKCINYDKDDKMTIYVNDTMLLIIGQNTNLLITTELTV
ncbi:MAG: hypothetical protein HPY57_13755 [Ignavibacteria bacterium]|nr:hypothetical protein [Ignavibacteria bacterium]